MKNRLVQAFYFGVLACLVVMGNAAAQEFDRLLVFGDSLSDGGTYSQAVILGGAPSTTAIGGEPMLYRFTDNDALTGSSITYAEGLAQLLGLPLDPALITGLPLFAVPDNPVGGGNFAQGGSRVSDPLGIGNNPGAGITTVPVSTQVSNFLGTSPTLGYGDLIIVWAGANDVFAQIAAVGAASITVQDAISNTATAAAGVRTQVDRLKAAGARNVMVVTVPDLGVNTPEGVLAGGATQALYTTLSDTFNTQLLASLAGTNAAIVDADKLLGFVLDDPVRYGFANIDQRRTTECTGSSLSCIQGVNTLSDGNARVFADSVHPTTQAHRLFAEAAYAGLLAVSQNAALSVGTLSALRQQSLGLDNRLNVAALSMKGPNGQRQRRPRGHVEVYGGVEAGSYEVAGGQVRPRGDGATQVVKVAGDVIVGEGVALGGGVSLDHGQVDFAGGHGGFDSRLMTAAVFGVAELFKGVYANFTAAYGHVDVHDIKRSFTLGQSVERYSGSTTGAYKMAAVGLGAMFPVGNGLVINPSAKLTRESVSIDGYTESNGAASLSYGDQEYEGLRASLGLGGFYRPAAVPRLVLSLRGSWEHDFNDDDIAVTFGPDAGNLATLGSPREDRTYGYLSTRVAYELDQVSSLIVSGSSVVGLEDNEGFTLGLTYKRQL